MVSLQVIIVLTISWFKNTKCWLFDDIHIQMVESLLYGVSLESMCPRLAASNLGECDVVVVFSDAMMTISQCRLRET